MPARSDPLSQEHEQPARKMGDTTFALFRIADLACGNLDSQAIHEVLLHNVSQVVRQDRAAMIAIDSGGLTVSGVTGDTPLEGRVGEELPDACAKLVIRAVGGKRMVTGVAGDGAPSILDHIFGKPVSTWAIVPVVASGEGIGALVLGRDAGPPFAWKDERVLRPMAGVIARLLETRILYEEMRDHSRHLAEEHRRVVEAHRLQREFISNVSHELRTPLTGILGFAELLQDDDVGGDLRTRTQYLGEIHDSGRNLLKLINQILDFGKMQAGQRDPQLESIDLAGAAQKTLDSLQAQALKKGLQLKAWSEEGALGAWADPTFCGEVLTNLVGNAIKFTDTGWVRVILRSVRARTRGAESTECIECRVVDTGPGIPFEQQQTVFEAFRQIDGSHQRRHGGTGLGLALCRDMVEAMDGRIWVESRAGEGSSFVFVLPAATPARQRSKTDGTGRSKSIRSISFGARPESQGPLVAVCLQESGATDQVCELLQATGYQVITAQGGDELLSLVRRRLPRAVVMDMHLPDMNGWQLLGALRAGSDTRGIGVLLSSPQAPAGGQAIRDGYGGCVELRSPLVPDRLLTWLSTLTEVEERPPARLVMVGFDGEFMAGISRESAEGEVAAFRCDSAADAVREMRKREPALLAWRPSDLDPTQHSLIRALRDLGLDAPPVVVVAQDVDPAVASLQAMAGVEFQQPAQATPASLVRLVKRLSAGDASDPALPGDPLTGLPGRDYLERRLAEEQHRADRYGRPFSVLTFSLSDGGKGGGKGGGIPSPVQRSAAEALRRALRVSDVIGRTGPGVFVALLPETSKASAEGARQRLVRLFPSGEVFGYPYACHCWSRDSSAKGSPREQLNEMFAETA